RKARAPEGRDAVGRRAADVRDRPRPDGTPAPPSLGRARARPRAPPRAGGLRGAEADPGTGRDGPLGRAERPPRARARRPGVCPGDRPRDAFRDLRGARPRPARPTAVSRHRLPVSTSGHVERLFSALEAEPEKTAIVFEGRSFAFGELDRLS